VIDSRSRETCPIHRERTVGSFVYEGQAEVLDFEIIVSEVACLFFYALWYIGNLACFRKDRATSIHNCLSLHNFGLEITAFQKGSKLSLSYKYKRTNKG